MPEVVQNAYTKSDTVFVATVTNVVPTHENKPNQVKAILKPVQIYKGDPSGLLEFDFELNSMGCGHIKPQRAGNSVMYFIQRFPSGGFHLLTLNLTDSSGVKINIQENAKIIEQVRRCCIPSDHIPLRSWPLFGAREVMRGLIETLKAKQAT